MRFLFIVQGEGRGHMTQAMTLSDMLIRNGHTVEAVIVGTAKRREVPGFFTQHFSCPVYGLPSPNFVTDREGKGINMPATICKNLLLSPRYSKSLKRIHRTVREAKPDVILNFYDFLGGLYSALYRPNIRYLVIGHQYLSHHPQFPFARGGRLDKGLLLLNNRITACRAERLLGLSFRPYPLGGISKLCVVPPLLRQKVKAQSVKNDSYLLLYMVNHGYSRQVEEWHARNRHVRLQCFWDNKAYPHPWSPHPNLTFHPLDGEKFLKMMAACTAYVSTAGFESVCEAMYMGKPAMLVPVEGHFEQACNAVDACLSGAGIMASTFDIDKLMEWVPQHSVSRQHFCRWADSAEDHLIPLLTGQKSRRRQPSHTAGADQELVYA